MPFLDKYRYLFIYIGVMATIIFIVLALEGR